MVTRFSSVSPITPSISVLTPSWNRGYLLPLLYRSLLSQGSINLEWIVVNDGSEDDTDDVMKRILEEATIPVVYARYERRVGKARSDNLLLDLSRADFIVWCDSDDCFIPNALVKLLELYYNSNSDSFPVLASAGFNVDLDGWLQTPGGLPSAAYSASLTTVAHNHPGDMTFLFRRSNLRGLRFPEVDYVISESVLWSNYYREQVAVAPHIVKVMNRSLPNRISNNTCIQYSRGMAIAISQDLVRPHAILPVKLYASFIRYSVHGDMFPFSCFKSIPFKFKPRYFSGLILGLLLSMYDSIFKVVDKTHVSFDSSRSLEPSLFFSSHYNRNYG